MEVLNTFEKESSKVATQSLRILPQELLKINPIIELF